MPPLQNVSKGNAVDRILERLIKTNHTPNFVLVVGDDRSDEDMFIAIEHVHFSPHVPAEVSVQGLSVAFWGHGVGLYGDLLPCSGFPQLSGMSTLTSPCLQRVPPGGVSVGQLPEMRRLLV